VSTRYKPYRATVVYHKTGEPEIIMQDTFKIDAHHTPEEWAVAIARVCIGYDWLWENIQIVTVTYWYGVWQASVEEDKEESLCGDSP
jgi:hypothetical protein